MKDTEIEVSTTSFRLPFKHIIHLIGLHALMLIGMLLLSLPIFESRVPLLVFCILSPILPIWQTNIIAPKVDKRIYHFQSRVIYSFLFSALFLFLRYIEGWKNNSLAFYLGLVVLTLVYSGLFSLIIYHLKINLVRSINYYFIGKSIWSIPIVVVLILTATIFKEGYYNPDYEEIKIWSDTSLLSYDDFKGYPYLFDHFDASISSTIEYRYDHENTLLGIDAVCYVGESWVNPWSKGSSNLLRHEAYHFKITEMVARMARKAAYEAMSEGVSKDSITVILAYHQQLRRKYQYEYDEETDHSLIVGKQSEWQYFIDSTLFELDAYWTSEIFRPRENIDSTIKYYRNININEKQLIYGSNELMPNEEKYTNHYKFIYDHNEVLKEVIYYSGGEVARDRFFEVAKVKIIPITDNTIEWRYFNKNDKPMHSEDKSHKKRLIYSGKKLSVTLYDLEGKQISFYKQVYKRIYDLDIEGRLATGLFLDKNNKYVVNKKGVYKVKYFYENDSSTLATIVKNYTINNRPTLNKLGVFQHIYTYNQDGNQTSYAEMDLESKYVYRKGYAHKVYDYNYLGQITHIYYLDEDSNLVENNKGIAIKSYSDDRYGNVNRYSRYNSNNVLKGDENGVAQYYYKYDAKRKVLSWAEYDTGSKLYFDEDGYGKVKYTYDSLGRRKTITNLNAYDYLLSRNKMGAITVLSYDTSKNIVYGHYLNEKGEKDTTGLGDASFQETYDENNNLLEIKMFDLEGKLYAPSFNTAIYRYQYDDRGNKVKASFFTAKGKPSYANKGVHINEYVYSKEDRLIERSYRDTSKNLIEYEGYARIKWKYDSLGNEIERRYYNKFDQLVDTGTAIIKTKWNTNNKIESEAEFDKLNKGIIMKKYEWDEYENIITSSVYTTEGLKTCDKDAIHKYVYEYIDGKYYGESYYDTLNNPVELDHVALINIERDSRGNIIVKKTYDRYGNLSIKEGEEFAIVKYQYDDYDRIISEKYYNENKEPASIAGKYHAIRYKLDKSGNVLWKGFFDQNDELTINKDGIALYRREYNRNTYATVSDDLKLRDAKKLIDDIEW